MIDKTHEKTNNSSAFKQLIKCINDEKYDYYFSFSPGWFGLFLGYYSNSKFKSALILQSRYKNNLTSKLVEKILGNLFYNNCIIVDRQYRFSKNISIHQTELMRELVIKSGLNINDNNNEIKKLFNIQKLNYISKNLCLIHLSSKWINRYFTEHINN